MNDTHSTVHRCSSKRRHMPDWQTAPGVCTSSGTDATLLIGPCTQPNICLEIATAFFCCCRCLALTLSCVCRTAASTGAASVSASRASTGSALRQQTLHCTASGELLFLCNLVVTSHATHCCDMQHTLPRMQQQAQSCCSTAFPV